MPVYPVSVNVLDPTIGEQHCNFPWVTARLPNVLQLLGCPKLLAKQRKPQRNIQKLTTTKHMEHRIAERILTAWWLATGFSIFFKKNHIGFLSQRIVKQRHNVSNQLQ